MSWNFVRIDQALLAAALDPSVWPETIECVSSETHSRCSLWRPGKPDEERSDARELKAVSFDDGPETHSEARGGSDRKSLGWVAEVRGEAGNIVWSLLAKRRPGLDRPFSSLEKRKFERLSQCLSRAVMIAQALDRTASSAALEAFDVGNIAVLLVDRAGEVVANNRASNALLKSGLRIVNRRLGIGDASAAETFDVAVRQIFSAQQEAAALSPVLLPRRGRPPVLAHLLKLGTVGTAVGAESLAAVILVDPNMRRKSSETDLHIAFRLTPAEAKLASALATGEPLDRICERLKISKETGRNQLKSIFAKTGTRRQAELVLVVASML